MKPTVESLLIRFKEHSIVSKLQKIKDISSFKENYPLEELPEHFNDDFNLPEALATICAELIALRKMIEDDMQHN